MASLTPRLDRLEINKIINGRLDFWQRATTASPTKALLVDGGNQYLADRFSSNFSATGLGNFTVSRASDVPNSESAYSFQFTTTTAGTNNAAHYVLACQHIIEGYEYLTLHGKMVTLSFWAKASVTGTYGLTLMNSGDTRAYATTYSITAANTWQKKTITVTLDSAGTWLFNNGAGLKIQWLTSAGSSKQITPNTWTTVSTGNVIASTASNSFLTTANATLNLAQICLVVGDTAPDYFVTAGRTIQEELNYCQRYYEKSYDVDTPVGTTAVSGFTTFRAGSANGTLTIRMSATFKVAKRATPVATAYSPSTGANDKVVIHDSTTDADRTVGTGGASTNTGTTSYTPAVNGITGNGMSFHWTADAEF